MGGLTTNAQGECKYHRKIKKAHDSPSSEVLRTKSSTELPTQTPIESPKVIPTVHSMDARREPNRKHSDDWVSQIRIDMGLPNHLLGYNITTKKRVDADVELKRRNVELMDSFTTMNESVANLLALLSMETAPGLPQTPDRTKCGGKSFTMANYLEVKCQISDKLAKIKS
jgi:hypothetical protein